MGGAEELTQTEALVFSVVAFVSDLAGLLGRTFEEVDQLLSGTPFHLWSMTDTPDGWTNLARLLSPPNYSGPFLTPTIH